MTTPRPVTGSALCPFCGRIHELDFTGPNACYASMAMENMAAVKAKMMELELQRDRLLAALKDVAHTVSAESDWSPQTAETIQAVLNAEKENKPLVMHYEAQWKNDAEFG